MDYKITPFTADTLSLLEKNEPCSPDFYILPSFITAPPCSEILSDKAKLLYGMMYTTMKLNSVRNGWIDEEGAFIYRLSGYLNMQSFKLQPNNCQKS